MKMRKHIHLMALVTCILFMSGCGKKLPATPVLDMVVDYTVGQNDIPAGKYLAVQAWTDSEGRSSDGTCPYASYMDMPMYGMSGTEINSYVEPQRDYSNNANPVDLVKAVGFYGDGSSHSGDMGGGASSNLWVIESLPATPHKSIFTILSAAADGTIVVQIGSQVYRMKPGQQWIQYSQFQADKKCRVVNTDTFTNYGLLDGSQIYFLNVPLVPGITPTP